MTEAQLQNQIVIFYRNNYQMKGEGLIFSVANESTYKNKVFKATGTLSGVSDLIVLLPNAKCLFIELKTETGIQSEKQKDFENVVSDLGFEYYLVKSLELFKSIINNALM